MKTKVWDNHTKGKDHLHSRAEAHIEKARAAKASAASDSDASTRVKKGPNQASKQARRDWSKTDL